MSCRSVNCSAASYPQVSRRTSSWKCSAAGFGETVGERFEQNARIIVMIGFEARDVLLDADTGRHGECTDPIFDTGVARRDVVGEALVRLSGRLPLLLSQMAEGERDFTPCLVGIDLDVVTHRVGGNTPTTARTLSQRSATNFFNMRRASA
jgi:hypothetical protein